MHRVTTTVICVFVLFVLTNCAVQQEADEPGQVLTRIVDINAAESDCGGLLIYYDSLTRLTKSELEGEQEILRQNLLESKNHCNRLRFVLFSILPEAGMNNHKEIDGIMKTLVAEKNNMQRDERQVLELLSDQIELKNTLRKKIKEHEKQIKNFYTQSRSEKKTSAQLQQQVDELQTKLLQLKNIEKKINAREQEISTPSTDRKAP